jgi:hypothetical protein
MKKVFYYLTGLFIVLSVFTACQEMDSTYKEFVVPGGIFYTGKAVDPVVYSGHNRAKIAWIKGADPSVSKARVFWNNYSDSVELEVPAASNKVSVIIDNLPEQFYSFFIKTYDEEGNSSVAAEALGAVYGNDYQASLLNRPVMLSIIDGQENVTIHWGAADLANGAHAIEVEYTNAAGEKVTKRMDAEESVSELAAYKPGTKFKYRTLFLPDSASIDTFYTGFTEANVSAKLDKSSWTATADTHEPTRLRPSGAPDKAIDGNINTYWHTTYPSTNPYPHWLMVDMKNPVTVSAVELVYRQNVYNSFTDFTIQGSLDGVNWTSYGSFSFKMINDPQNFQLPGSPVMQYVRIYATKGVNNYAHIGELAVYGY